MSDKPISTEEMVRGLVRAAELYERVSAEGQLWDDEARIALETARARGWARGEIGTLHDAPLVESVKADGRWVELITYHDGTTPLLGRLVFRTAEEAQEFARVVRAARKPTP